MLNLTGITRSSKRKAVGAAAVAGCSLLGMFVAASPASATTFKTVGTNVNIRKCEFANLSACSVVKTLAASGTAVNVICWDGGSSVNGDSTWYSVSSPAVGYIAGYWLNTGHDPNSGVPQCRS